ncbi:MAG: hypothetical protein WA900_09550 [Casimicrobiaceae bacterium]
MMQPRPATSSDAGGSAHRCRNACLASLDLNDIKKDDVAFDLPMVSVAEALPYSGSANKLVSL